jgi:hypothetical protein
VVSGYFESADDPQFVAIESAQRRLKGQLRRRLGHRKSKARGADTCVTSVNRSCRVVSGSRSPGSAALLGPTLGRICCDAVSRGWPFSLPVGPMPAARGRDSGRCLASTDYSLQVGLPIEVQIDSASGALGWTNVA